MLYPLSYEGGCAVQQMHGTAGTLQAPTNFEYSY